VTIHAAHSSLSDVLRKMFAQPIDGTVLSFTIEQGCVLISFPDAQGRYCMTRVYDVRDILATTPHDRWPEAVEKLMKLMTDTIAPESWRDVGGTLGCIRDFDGRLFVTQTWANHERVAATLNYLRKTGVMPMPQTSNSR